ncbi:MAG: hypothetical protein FJX92_05715 [Bacteroidetes bacterium]|nr:hypothetical protein [Bacteroidota bacterium]
MKKLIPLLLLTVGIIGTAFAQKKHDRSDDPPPHHGKGRMGPGAGIPWEELSITDEQRDAFRKQRETFRKKMKALRKEEDITVKEWKSRLQNLRQENRSVMQNILTKEQKEKIKTIREERGNRQIERMKERLGLSSEQVEKIKKQRAKMQKEVQALQENKSLSVKEKKEAMQNLKKEQKESLEKILTTEQLKKMKERHFRKDGPPPGPGRKGKRPPPADDRL